MRRVSFLLGISLIVANAQYLGHRDAGIPRTKDGKPNLSAPTPRAANGKADLSGIWQAEASPFSELAPFLGGGVNGLGEDVPSKYFISILADFKPEEAPLQPAAAAAFRKHAQDQGKDAPNTHCLPYGVPNYDTVPAPFKLVQTPSLIVMLHEADTSFRQIFTDGRKLPVDPQPAWLGYFAGTWDGDTLVVETAGFNDRGWLDVMGHVHSEALHVIERFHRRDFGHMDVQITVEDPKTLTKPVTFTQKERLLADTDLLEYFCPENEKDVAHLTK